ncbi:MAG: helix-turn-helix domain-containing protein [Acidimicrobiales bacterium]
MGPGPALRDRGAVGEGAVMGLDGAFESFARRLEATMDRLAAQLDRIDRGPTPLVYTPDEAGTLLGVSEDTVRRWVKAGHLPRLPHTDRMLIPRKAVEAFVQARVWRGSREIACERVVWGLHRGGGVTGWWVGSGDARAVPAGGVNVEGGEEAALEWLGSGDDVDGAVTGGEG